MNIFVKYNNDSSKENYISPRRYNYFKKIPFYNTHIEKPKIKRLKNIDLLSALPFYEELNVIKTDQAFKGYVMHTKLN